MINSFLETDLRVYQSGQGCVTIARKDKSESLAMISNNSGRWICTQNHNDYTNLIHKPLELVNAVCKDLNIHHTGA
jgi:hypothetical protein